MKICFINPPYTQSILDNNEYDPYKPNIQSPGLGYLAASIEREGHSVTVLECPANQWDLIRLCQHLENNKYDAYGLSILYTTLLCAAKIARVIRKRCFDTFIFAGGIYPSIYPEDTLDVIPELDCCVIGDGEEILTELMLAANGGIQIDNIRGVAYSKNGKFVITPPFISQKSLDDLPYPKISYMNSSGTFGIVSSRGCYGSCTFCASNTYKRLRPGPLVKCRSCKNIIGELEWLIKEYHAKNFIFFDDNFLYHFCDPDFMREFSHLIHKKALSFHFQITARADDIIRYSQYLDVLTGLGLDMVFTGVESFVPRQLDLFRKGVTAEKNIQAIQILKEKGIPFSLGLILFDPYTTIDELIYNIDVLLELEYYNTDYAGAFPVSLNDPLKVVKGSPIYFDFLQKCLLKNNENGYDFIHKKTERFYDCLNNWRKKIQAAAEKYYLTYKAHKQGIHELAFHLLNEKKKLMELDMLCFRRIAQLCATEMGTGEIMKIIEREYLNDLLSIEQTFKKAEYALEQPDKRC